MVKIAALIAAAMLASTLPASAQATARVTAQAMAQERAGPPVRVQVGFSVFVPGEVGDVDDPKLQQVRRSFYELAIRECDLLRDVIAKDCRLESIQVNVNRQQSYGQHAEGFQANANVSLQITPK